MKRLAFVLALVACGGGGAPPSAPSATAPTGSAAPSTTPALRLGHYATLDGRIGFVLDRTGSKPRVRFDGEEAVYSLETDTASYQGQTDYVSHERHITIRVDAQGQTYVSLKGQGTHPVARDAAAAPLP